MKPEQLKQLVEYTKKVTDLNERWTPHEKQKELIKGIFTDGYSKVFVRAGRRAGKTQAALYIVNRVAGLNPNKRCLIITPNLKQAKKIYWKSRELHNFPPPSWIRKAQNDETTLYYHNHSYIELDGSENIDAHRGVSNDIVILDEFKDINPDFLYKVILPTFATTAGIVVVIGTPPDEMEGHHFYETEMSARKDPSWLVIDDWGVDKNPHADIDWVNKERERYKARGDEDVFEREFMGRYVRGGKKVILPTFSPETHVRPYDTVIAKLKEKENIGQFEPYILADPGTSAAFAALLIAFNRAAGQVLVLDEVYITEKSKTGVKHAYGEIIAMAKGIFPLSQIRFAHDDAASWLPAEVLSQHNIHTVPAGKASTDRDAGISLWKDIMTIPNAYYVTDRCTNFITEKLNYIMVNGKYPTKKDHLIDTFRYFLNFAKVAISAGGGSRIDSDIDSDYTLYDHIDDLPSWIA